MPPTLKPSQTLIEVRDLALQREKPILRGMNWKMEAGQHWVILGPNGSGKTTLLSALLAYRSPTRGEIRLLGQKYGACDWRDLRKGIGIVSSSIRQMIRDEEPVLHAVASGQDAILNYWGSLNPAMLRRAEKLLSQVECKRLRDQTWGTLSQGEQQRVLIGRAMMASPKILFLDEPCAGLDLVARETFLKFLQKIGKKRDMPSLVLVTHHVEEIVPIFSHVLILKKGRVLASGLIDKTLTSKNLSEAFEAKIRLHKRQGQWSAQVASRVKAIL